MLFEASQRGISDFLGAASITCWLFAQFPQVIENYRLGSCKGLALPFLVNWLLGDLTNLIGCIFTDQLPFQTYLAAYFTLVDAVLILQFWYYGRKHKHRLRHAQHEHVSRQASREGSQYLHQSGSRPRLAHSRTRSGRSGVSYSSRPGSLAASYISNGYPKQHAHNHKLPEDDSHTLKDSQSLVRFEEPQSAFPPNIGAQKSGSYHSDSNSDTEPRPEMTESTLSKRSDASSSTIGAADRGRSNHRTATSTSAPTVLTPTTDDGYEPVWRQLSGSRTRGLTANRDRSSQSRTRSVVFLSIWAFMGFGGLYTRNTQFISQNTPPSAFESAWKVRVPRSELVASTMAYATGISTLEDGIPPPPMDYSLLVGRIAAWMCVCFYLTSRMPQIWKNFRRQSVEGLSILLFAAAFMGNLFYVLSILYSPLIQEDEDYLFESVPFLLGSGGTLIFDLTIMGQACIYSRPASQPQDKAGLVEGEESSGLLARDSHNDLRNSLE